VKGDEMKKLAGDAFYIYITPPGTAYPRIRIWKRPYGLKGSNEAPMEGELGKYWQHSLEELAEVIGKAIVKHSSILQEWGDRG
jgi:hypothetical protein